jgi:hypothetical protein
MNEENRRKENMTPEQIERETQRAARIQQMKERQQSVISLAQRMVTAGRRSLASKQHPDRGGTDEHMAFINEVHDRLQKLITTNFAELI